VIVLAPLAVLAGPGLGRIPPIGLLAILTTALLLWHGRPTARALDRKSNVAHVARFPRPELAAGTFVFSTQPEQVPELAHELPAGMRFETPLGGVADPRVMDWRDALPRLRAARFDTVLGPALRRLHPGDARACDPARVQPSRLAVDAPDPDDRAAMGRALRPRSAGAPAARAPSPARQFAVDGERDADGARAPRRAGARLGPLVVGLGVGGGGHVPGGRSSPSRRMFGRRR
jgi:hypothetical protein